MSKKVRDYILRYNTCQRVQISRHCLYSKLLVLPIPQGPILKLTMDFIIGLPPTKIRTEEVANAILVIVNRYIKFLGYFAVITTITAAELADLFLERWLLFGTLRGIIPDKGTIFNSVFWASFYLLLKIRRKISTAFYPQIDGQIERLNALLEHYLHCYINY